MTPTVVEIDGVCWTHLRTANSETYEHKDAGGTYWCLRRMMLGKGKFDNQWAATAFDEVRGEQYLNAAAYHGETLERKGPLYHLPGDDVVGLLAGMSRLVRLDNPGSYPEPSGQAVTKQNILPGGAGVGWLDGWEDAEVADWLAREYGLSPTLTDLLVERHREVIRQARQGGLLPADAGKFIVNLEGIK
jgi:hypothetical protein